MRLSDAAKDSAAMDWQIESEQRGVANRIGHTP